MIFFIRILSIHSLLSASENMIEGDNHRFINCAKVCGFFTKKGYFWSKKWRYWYGNFFIIWLLSIHSHLSASKNMIRGDNHGFVTKKGYLFPKVWAFLEGKLLFSDMN